MHTLLSSGATLATRLGFLILVLGLATFVLTPSLLAAADDGPVWVEAKGSGSGGGSDDDDDSRSGDSGSSNSGSSSDDDDDDDGRDDDDDSGSRSGSSGSSGGGSSSDDADDDDDDSRSSGSSSSNSGSSDATASSSGSSNSSDDDSRSSSTGGNSSSSGDTTGSTSDTVTQSTRQRFEGKTRALINGFQAEFSVRREVRFDREKFRAEASNLNLGAGARFAVCFNGSSLGDITLNSLNYGELELDSRLGHQIPDFTGGETVELRSQSCGGALVLSATFGNSGSAAGPSTPSIVDRSRIEGKARRLINGFEAEFNVRLERRPDRDKFRAEAESLNLGAGTRLDVCFQGQFLGDIFLNSLNFGELELDSRLGHTFPIFDNGDTIELRQGGCAGELLMAATFGGGSTTLSGSDVGAASGSRTEIEGKTRLVINGFEAEFSVRFEQRPDRSKIRAEVSNLDLTPGSLLTVCFEGSALGQVRLNAIHFAELELDSRLGHVVPILQAGDQVWLHGGPDCAANSAILSATLGVGE